MRHSKQYRDTAEDARTIVPTLIAAMGIWMIVLAGFVTTAHEYPLQTHTPAVHAVVKTDNEPLELAILREVSEVEPQRRRTNE